jgi:hypothetical protein
MQKLGLPLNKGLPTNTTDSFLVDDTNTIPITAQDALREIDLSFIYLHRTSAPAAIIALYQCLPSTLVAENKRQGLIATRTPHLFLLGMKILDKPLDIPSIPLQFVEKLPGSFVRKEPIQVVLSAREEGIKIYLSLLLLFRIELLRLIVFLFHKISLLYRIASRFCQLCTNLSI